MITPDHELPISTQAKLLNISRSTVYYLPKPTSPKDLAIMRQLDELHLSAPRHWSYVDEFDALLGG